MMKKLNMKETDISVIGVIVTVILYVMNVLGTGVIVGGDIGHIDTGIPFYGFLAPVIFTAFAAFTGYYTKSNSMAKAFKAIYITLLLPFVAYPTVMLFTGTPIIILPMYLAMPIGSLHNYLWETCCDLLKITDYETENLIMILIIVVMLIPIIVAPMVYRFTRTQEKED